MRRRAGRAIQFGAFREPRRQQHPVFFGRLQLPGWRGRTMLQRRAPPSVAFAAFLGAAIIGGGTLAADAAGPVKQTVEIDLTLWPLRDIASVRDDPFGVLVKYGCTLFTDTANQIGPTAADQALRREEAYDVAVYFVGQKRHEWQTATRIFRCGFKGRSTLNTVPMPTSLAQSSTNSARSSRSAPRHASWPRSRGTRKLLSRTMDPPNLIEPDNWHRQRVAPKREAILVWHCHGGRLGFMDPTPTESARASTEAGRRRLSANRAE
jgi:hypothetical protein